MRLANPRVAADRIVRGEPISRFKQILRIRQRHTRGLLGKPTADRGRDMDKRQRRILE